MKILPSTLFAALLAMAGCSLFTPKETLYLQSAQDRATQGDVQQNLGSPRQVSTMPTGESKWVYEVREVEPGAQNSWASAGSWCDEYVLTFDSKNILRNWTHKSFFHGGENMPASCDGRIGVEKPAL